MKKSKAVKQYPLNWGTRRGQKIRQKREDADVQATDSRKALGGQKKTHFTR